MKRNLKLIFSKLFILFINYILYYPISDIVSSSGKLAIVLIALITFFITIIIAVRKINIADYSGFVKKYEKIFEWTILAVVFFLIICTEALYSHMGISLFVLFNVVSIFVSLLEIESEKRCEEKRKGMIANNNRFI